MTQLHGHLPISFHAISSTKEGCVLKFKYTGTVLLIVIFLALVAFPVILLHSSESGALNNFLREHPDIDILTLFNTVTDYLSLGITLLLGVIVYRQSQKINDLESSQYDVFIGAVSLDHSLTPLSSVLVENSADRSDFSIKQSVDTKSFFTHLKTNFPDRHRQIFLPITFITRNHPLIVSLKFSEIQLVVVESSGRKTEPQRFLNHADPIYGIFEDNTQFLFGIGFMLPDEMRVGQILLHLYIDATDQIGRITPLEIDIQLQTVDKCLHLVSSQTKRR